MLCIIHICDCVYNLHLPTEKYSMSSEPEHFWPSFQGEVDGWTAKNNGASLRCVAKVMAYFKAKRVEP